MTRARCVAAVKARCICVTYRKSAWSMQLSSVKLVTQASAYLSIDGLVELDVDGIRLSLGCGGDLQLVLGQVDCWGGVGDVDGDIDQVGSLGPEDYET